MDAALAQNTHQPVKSEGRAKNENRFIRRQTVIPPQGRISIGILPAPRRTTPVVAQRFHQHGQHIPQRGFRPLLRCRSHHQHLDSLPIGKNHMPKMLARIDSVKFHPVKRVLTPLRVSPGCAAAPKNTDSAFRRKSTGPGALEEINGNRRNIINRSNFFRVIPHALQPAAINRMRLRM